MNKKKILKELEEALDDNVNYQGSFILAVAYLEEDGEDCYSCTTTGAGDMSRLFSMKGYIDNSLFHMGARFLEKKDSKAETK